MNLPTAFFITTEGTMVSNDILRSVRYILKINNNDLVRIFALGEAEVTAEQLVPWLRKEDEEGFTELTLRTLESRTPLIRCHRQHLVNMAHLKEIRLEDNGQAELLLRNGLTVPVSRRYLKTLKEALGL